MMVSAARSLSIHSMRKNLCSLMFTDVTVRPNGQMGNCCKSESAVVTESEVRSLGARVWNSNAEFLRRKTEMLTMDRMPDSCRSCSENPGNNFFTMRNTWTDIHDPRSDDDILHADNIRLIELYLDTSCDLACAYCGPNHSSTWAKQLGITEVKQSSSYTAALLQSLYDYLGTVDWQRLRDRSERFIIRFLGGEPTYIPITLSTMRNILTRVPHDALRIEIVSNLNTKPRVLDQYIALFDSAPEIDWTISVSIDDIGERCAAVRYGLDWDRVVTNLQALWRCANIHLVLAPTVNMFNLPHLADLYRHMRQLSQGHACRAFTYGMTPVYDNLSISRLPVSMAHHLQSAAAEVEDARTRSELLHLRSLLGTQVDRSAMAGTLRTLRMVLSRPGHDYGRLFPHLAEIFAMV